MIKLAHRILANEELDEKSKALKAIVKGATILDVTNVSQYMEENSSQFKSWNVDYPQSLPFDDVIFGEFFYEKFKDRILNASFGFGAITEDEGDNGGRDSEGNPFRFRTRIMFARFFRQKLEIHHCIGRVFFDSLGNVVGSGPDFRSVEGLEIDETTVNVQLGHSFRTFMLAMSFANCKNVVRQEAGKECEPDRPWANKHQIPKIRFHTLQINPMREVLLTEGQSDKHGILKAFHMCRGHFKTYDAEHPRFGRDVGTFWCPSHMRGNTKQGIVLKNYQVNSPK